MKKACPATVSGEMPSLAALVHWMAFSVRGSKRERTTGWPVGGRVNACAIFSLLGRRVTYGPKGRASLVGRRCCPVVRAMEGSGWLMRASSASVRVYVLDLVCQPFSLGDVA